MGIILASASPRRYELMQLITSDFTVITADVDEAAVLAPTPLLLVQALAKAKCMAVAKDNSEHIVIGCDTVVDIDGKVYGKPHTKAEAEAVLTLLADRPHLVHTGVAIYHSGEYHVLAETTKVFFGSVPNADLLAYVNTQEPYDKAGGYGIQGWAAKYIYRIEGCYFNIMGLPVSRLARALAEI